jgi:hypothetical protein
MEGLAEEAKDEVRQRYQDFPLKPSFLLNSGGEIHIYWLLREPVSKEIPLAEKLSLYFGRSRTSTDASRILRIPKTFNYKYTFPKEITLMVCKPQREYNLSDFDFLLKPEPLPESDNPTEGANPQAEDKLIEEYPFNEGWIKLHRKIIENPIFKDSEACHLFVYLLLKANHKTNRFPFNRNEVRVERGQLITGVRKISHDTGITEWKIRERIKLLENLGIITRKTTHRFSIINICNYNHYQEAKIEEPHTKPHSKHEENDQIQIGLPPHTDHTLTTTNKNDKNIKIYVEGSDELRLATLLLEEIQRNKKDCNLSPFKQPDLQMWAREIDLMIQRDGRKPERIEAVIRWCQKDPFWWKNILSTGKLRKQFDTLEAQMVSFKKGKEPERPKEKPRVLTAED